METYREKQRDGFEMAIKILKAEIRHLCLKKRSNMTADYAWAIDDICSIIKRMKDEY